MTYSRSLLSLVFADPEYDGLEVRMRRPSIADLLDLASYSERLDATTTRAERGKEIRAHLEFLASRIVSWNLGDSLSGEPVPISGDGLATLDWPFVNLLETAWARQAAEVDPPSPAPSNDGGPFPEVPLPMEELSPNPSS